MHSIIEYKRIFLPVLLKGDHTIHIAIRSFIKIDHISSQKTSCFLLVNPYNFQTSVKNDRQLCFRKHSKYNDSKVGYFTWQEISDTPYVKALFKYTSPQHYNLENSGLIKAESNNLKGACLTIDLCPSGNSFEKEFFNMLIANNVSRPIPIAIAISGLWLIHHRDEFLWLLEQESAGYLNITWVNHSYSHLYLADLPYEENFMLFALTNLDAEFLETEKLLLADNQMPSVFFRFPGLVSNKTLISQSRKYGHIPLGANSWIAKNHIPEFKGDIILLHGNGNETEGIKKITPYIKKQEHHWLSLQDILY